MDRTQEYYLDQVPSFDEDSMSSAFDHLTQSDAQKHFSVLTNTLSINTDNVQVTGAFAQIKDEIESALRAAERAEDNSTINKFIRNLESRIYSQISKGLVDSMFCNPGEDVTCTNSTQGAFTIEDSNVSYQVVNIDGIDYIRLTIVDADGTITEIEIPIGIGTLGG